MYYFAVQPVPMPTIEIVLTPSISKTENIFVGSKKEVAIKAFKDDVQDHFILKQFCPKGKELRKVIDTHELVFNTNTFSFLILEYNGLDSIRLEISYS